jgi:hypothetical protein
MAEPLDDTDDRRPADRPPDDRPPDDRPEDWLERRHPELEAAEFEAEQPARDLTGLPKLVISVAAVAVSLYALLWVVRPQPAQPFRARRRRGPSGPHRPPLTLGATPVGHPHRVDQPGSRARQWTVPLIGGSAAVPISSWS